MGIRHAAGLAAALAVATAPAMAQQPRFGIGIGGGMVLGSELVHHEFTVAGTRPHHLSQRVLLTELAVASLLGEWYPARHLAVRVHSARGSGRLEAHTRSAGGEPVDVTPFQTGFGPVHVTAVDAGLSLWPWPRRSEGFAPFVTIGAGTVRYAIQNNGAGGAFFTGNGTRVRSAFTVGAGADMNVWNSVMLRFEAVNHVSGSPVTEADFREFGEPRAVAGGELGNAMSNVRLVVGAHVYFPFIATAGLP